MEGLTLDTGALIAIERALVARTPAAQWWERALTARRPITVPAVVVTEWWRGQSGPAARLLDGVDVEPLERPLAESAGRVLAILGRRVQRERLLAIDAIVVASAARRGDIVHTSDVDDLERVRDAGGFAVRIFRA